MAITLVEEDLTGLSTANVYPPISEADAVTDCVVWLSDRGYPAFAAGSATERQRWLLEATETMERSCAPFACGFPVGGDDQALIFVRYNAVDARHRAIDSDEVPVRYREGIYLLAEDIAAAAAENKRITDLRDDESLASERIDDWSAAYRPGPVSFEARHRAAFERAHEAFPRGRRSARA